MAMTQNNKPLKIYTASAGSGKTFTIVKEYLLLCLGNNAAAYREILAVTFTNKAANEMKAKILEFLLGIAERSQKDDIIQMKSILLNEIGITEQELVDRCKKLYTNILHNYSDMSVSTIDSFVQHLSRGFARELNLPNQYSVMLDKDDLVDEILQMLSDEIGRDTFITNMLSEYVKNNLSEETSWNVRTVIGDFIIKLLEEDAYYKGGGTVIIDKSKYDEINQFVKEKVKNTDAEIDDIIEEIKITENNLGVTVDDYAGKSRGLPSVVNKMTKRESCIATDSVKKILSGESEWKNKKSNVSGDDMLYCFQKAVENYKDKIGKLLVFKSIKKYMYLYVLRNHILELIRQFILESLQVHISEFNKRISDILGDCSVPFIYERIGEKYKHYFIDEFQDTSVLQWQNFLPLIDNSLSGGNKNFIVGDAKQSIYRFRGGEVEQIINLPRIFNKPKTDFARHCESQFVNSADKLSLNTNYRSYQCVVKFNNTFFRFAARYLESDGGLGLNKVFDDTEQLCNRNEKGLVSVEMFSGDLETKQYNEKVFESMLSKIRELRKEGFDYKDVTILVRTNSEGTKIANYLVENGVEVMSAESVQLQTSDKVLLIVNTLHYLVDNENPVTIKNMSYFFEQTHQGNKMDLINNGKKLSLGKQVEDELQLIHNQAYSIYDLCVQICKYYGFNVLEDVFVQYFMNMLYDWQCSHSAGIDAFVDFWENKKSKLSVQITGDLDCVNIMTIHKSKGLEFNIVMYPFANTNLNSSAGMTKNEIWIKCSEDDNTKDIPYLDAFLLPISKKSMKDTVYENVMKHEQQKSMLDTLNVMYVSMTRAKQRLYIYTSGKVSKTEGSYNIFNNFFSEKNDISDFKGKSEGRTFDDYFMNMEEVREEIFENRIIYTYGDAESAKKNVAASVEILELKDTEPTPTTLNWYEKLSTEPDPTMIWSHNGTFMPDEWGSLVHEMFSKINTIADADRAMKPYINDGTIDEKQAEKLISLFRKMADNECLKPAFSDDAVVMNEMDIHTSKGKLFRPDRYAVAKTGTILIDYKTGKRNKKYHEQLQNYVNELREMNGDADIKAYLVYLGDDVEVEEVVLDRKL